MKEFFKGLHEALNKKICLRWYCIIGVLFIFSLLANSAG